MKAVRYIGTRNPLSAAYDLALAEDSEYAIVNTLPKGGNVTVELKLDGHPLEIRHRSLTRDFLDFATLVYVVDELELRSESEDGWSRSFEICFPVRHPERWKGSEHLLSGMLHTLSGDEFKFRWCGRPKLQGFGRHRAILPTDFDAVCLFSGGVDSFLGAFRLLSAGVRLLLVGHQADGTAAAAQKELSEDLRRRFPGQLALVQCRVARSMAAYQHTPLPPKVEETHRPRSFLFLALAIAVSNALNLNTIYIPENGLIALNPPLAKNRLGTLSTRTAHPKYLSELADFLAVSGIYRGQIKNPFLFESKTDMIRVMESSLASSIQRSVSCARPSRYKQHGVRHCGYCVPCIYRRVALMQAQLDSPADYAFALFENFAILDNSKRIDFQSLVAFAQRVVSGTSLQRELMVLSHGHFPLSAAARFSDRQATSYSMWGLMLLRWATDFLEKVYALASSDAKRMLGLVPAVEVSSGS